MLKRSLNTWTSMYVNQSWCLLCQCRLLRKQTLNWVAYKQYKSTCHNPKAEKSNTIWCPMSAYFLIHRQCFLAVSSHDAKDLTALLVSFKASILFLKAPIHFSKAQPHRSYRWRQDFKLEVWGHTALHPQHVGRDGDRAMGQVLPAVPVSELVL